MLRAFTSYFFGGIQDETPEAPIECETREVNDWLVVNLPDQKKDNINLNEDDDTYQIDDGDIRNEMDDEEDDGVEVDASDVDDMDEEENGEEDEILMSLSFLMMPPAESDSIFTELLLEPYPMSQYYDLLAPPNWDNRQLMEVERASEQILDLVFPVQPPRPCDRYGPQNEALIEFFNGGRKVEKRGQRNDIVSEYDRVNAQAIELAPPPTYSKSYVNHRHPEKLLSHGSDYEKRKSYYEEKERIEKQQYEAVIKILKADADRMQEEYHRVKNQILAEMFFESSSTGRKFFTARTRSKRAEQERRFREEEEKRHRRFHENEDYRKRVISDAIAKCPLKDTRLRQIGERERKCVFDDASAKRNDFYKINILQRIKELEPEQQAAQRSAKKILTRGQLNRQNKNYMYETSSKKNRRSNLQRNHSGANNNRKC